MKRRHTESYIISLALIVGFALSACGIRGDLKRPAPLWGEDIRSEAEIAQVEKVKADKAAQKAAKKAAKEAEKAE